MDESNPFLQAATIQPNGNPFLEAAEQEEQQKQLARRKDGTPRATRPDGSYYSLDKAERHAQLVEDGKIGPEFGVLSSRGKKERSRRAAQAVAEFAKDNADAIRAVFRDGIDDDQPQAIRNQTVKLLLDVEREEDRLSLQERQQAFDEMNKDQLTEEVLTMFNRLSEAGQLSGEIIESTAVEIENET